MQHLQPNTTLQGGKYRIEQKQRYLKVFLFNTADCIIVQKYISILSSVEKVNITNLKRGDLTVHHQTGKPDLHMTKDVEQALYSYYSINFGDIALKQTNRLLALLKMNSLEKIQLKNAMESYKNGDFRHAFDDYRLCLEYYLREMFGNNKTLENQIQELRNKMKDSGFSVQLRNAVEKGLDCFCKFQNENIKHHNNISLIDSMTIFSWGNMILEQMIVLDNILNWNNP